MRYGPSRRGARWWRRRPTAAVAAVVLMAVAGCATSTPTAETPEAVDPAPAAVTSAATDAAPAAVTSAAMITAPAAVTSAATITASAAEPSDAAITAPAAETQRANTGPAPIVYLALGDSNVYGLPDDCGRCTTYPHLVPDALARATMRTVTLVDATQHNRLTAAGLLLELKTDNWLDAADHPVRTDLLPRAAVAAADIITLTVSANDIPWYQNEDSCHNTYGPACVEQVQQPFATALDGALAEIVALRAGKPTAIRVTTFYNDLLAGPEYSPSVFFSEAQIAQASTTAKSFLDTWNGAICSVAAAHGGLCIDLYHSVNGPNADIALPAGYFTAQAGDLGQAGQDRIATLMDAAGWAPVDLT